LAKQRVNRERGGVLPKVQKFYSAGRLHIGDDVVVEFVALSGRAMRVKVDAPPTVRVKEEQLSDPSEAGVAPRNTISRGAVRES